MKRAVGWYWEFVNDAVAKVRGETYFRAFVYRGGFLDNIQRLHIIVV